MTSTDDVTEARRPADKVARAEEPTHADAAGASCGAPPRVVQPDKAGLLRRLNRIGGQVQGVSRMIEDDRYCVDVLTQLAAVKSALNQVSMQLLENHARGCVARALDEGDGEASIEELLHVLRRLDGKAFS